MRLQVGDARIEGNREESRTTVPPESTLRKIVGGDVPQNALGYRDHCMQTNLGDGSSTDARTHEFAARPALLRKALELHQD
jgi:hypothetical protein